MADLKTNELEHYLENKFERFWEEKKHDMDIMIDEIINGYLSGATTITVIKQLRLDSAGST